MSGRPATNHSRKGDFALAVCMPDEAVAPPGWCWVALSDVAQLASGHTPSREHPEYWGGDIPWISVKDARTAHGGLITETVESTNQAGIDNSAAVVLPAGTVCLSRTGSIGYSLILGKQMATSQGFVNWICGEALTPEFLRGVFVAENRFLHSISEGMAHTTIYFPEVKAFHVCLPPVGEQKRIVVKVGDLTARSRRAKEALDAVTRLLDQLRHSILAAAFRGDLTADWRAKNPNVEPADRLLARIRTNRRMRADRMADDGRDEETREVSAENAALSQPHLERTSSIGWAIAGLESLCDPTRPITYGIVQTGDPTIGGVPTVRCGDVTESGIDIQRLKCVDRKIEAQYPRTRLRGGEVLVAIRGTVGAVAVAGSNLAGANISREVAMLAPLPGVDSEFLALALSSPLGIAFLAHHTKGVAQAGVNIGDLRAFPVVVPPELEQREIVRKVNAAMEQLRKVATSVQERRASLDLLDQSVLGKAFQGALVPQDPNEEPASILLDRIRMARGTEREQASVISRRSRIADHVVALRGDDHHESEVPPRRPNFVRSVSKDLGGIKPENLETEVSAALWINGPLEKDEAVRRVADHLRQAGHLQFERLRADGPLFAHVLGAIESAVKVGRLDRPKRGYVRACKADATTYTPDDWRQALVASLGTDPLDRDDAIRAAAEWARDNLGLEFSRLREDGHIVEGLRSALNSAIRRGEVIRHDAKLISRKK